MAFASTRRNKSNGTDLYTCYRPSQTTSFASSTSSGFSSCSSTNFFARATSPTRVNFYGHHRSNDNHHVHRSSSSVRFSIDQRSVSPNRSISFTRQTGRTGNTSPYNSQKRTCACSPTTHPGSFRCALHRRMNSYRDNKTVSASYHSSSSSLNFRRSAMTNSLVRIGGVEGELVKRALTALIRPSSHQQRRRAAFEPRPSRLSRTSKAEDL